MFERCIEPIMLLREERVLPSPNLQRQDNDGKNKVTEGCRLRLANKALFDLKQNTSQQLRLKTAAEYNCER